MLILTTFDLDEYVYDALRAGASGFLLKDVRPDQLVDADPGRRARARRCSRRGHAPADRATSSRAAAGAARRRRGLDELTAARARGARLSRAGCRTPRSPRRSSSSETTVKTHVARVLAKLGLRDRVQAVVLAYESGLVSPAPSSRAAVPSRGRRSDGPCPLTLWMVTSLGRAEQVGDRPRRKAP